MGENRFHYLEEIAHEGENIKAILNRLASENNIDVTVVGFHGRKGPKADSTVMGSAI